MFVTFLVFFAMLVVLVLVHEFGHFISARKIGVKVEEFAFGFPPRLFGIKRGETLYSFNLLPLGGFVRIFGENKTVSDDPKNFASRSIVERGIILFGGVFFNLVLAYIIFTLLLIVGLPTEKTDLVWGERVQNPAVTIVGVFPESPAQISGIAEGDRILKLLAPGGNELSPTQTIQVKEFAQTYRGEEIEIILMRGDRQVTARPNLPGESEDDLFLGIAMSVIGIVKVPWYIAPWSGFEMTVDMFGRTASGFFTIIKSLFSGGDAGQYVAGPIGIFSLVDATLTFGLSYLLSLVALLSLTLAFINLIPFPGLDGGRLFFLVIEGIRRRPINEKANMLIHASGFILLLLLMAIITYYDIARFFTG